MSEGPTYFEIQDLAHAGAIRTAVWAVAFIAAVSFGAPWEIGSGGVVWTWDIWSGSEAFHLIPLAAGVVLAVLGAFEAVPGIAIGALSLAAGVSWAALYFERFAPAFGWAIAGSDTRAALAASAVAALLAGLACRRAFHRSVAARIVTALAAMGTIAVFVIPMGPGDTTIVKDVIVDAVASAEIRTILDAIPPALVALAAVGSFATLLRSRSSTGGLCWLTLVLFHVVAASVAFGYVPVFAAGLTDAGALTYGLFAAPLKLGLLWYAALLLAGLGAGGFVAALEARIRRVPVPGYRAQQHAAAPYEAYPVMPAGSPPGLPYAAVPVHAPPGPIAGPHAPAVPVHAAHDAGPLGPPPGWAPSPAAPSHAVVPPTMLAPAAPAVPVPAPAQVRPAPFHVIPTPPLGVASHGGPSADEIVEIRSSQALQILTEPDARSPGAEAASSAAPAQRGSGSHARFVPTAAPPNMGAGAQAGGRKAMVKTQVGMPPVIPGARTNGRMPAGAADSGRTGDTSFGMPAVAPRPPRLGDASSRAAPAGGPPTTQPEKSSSRLWPPPGGFLRKPPGQQPEPAPMVHDQPVPTVPGSIPAMTSEDVRGRVSNLQRQLARGAISPDEYQKRLDEILKSRGR